MCTEHINPVSKKLPLALMSLLALRFRVLIMKSNVKLQSCCCRIVPSKITFTLPSTSSILDLGVWQSPCSFFILCRYRKVILWHIWHSQLSICFWFEVLLTLSLNKVITPMLRIAKHNILITPRLLKYLVIWQNVESSTLSPLLTAGDGLLYSLNAKGDMTFKTSSTQNGCFAWRANLIVHCGLDRCKRASHINCDDQCTILQQQVQLEETSFCKSIPSLFWHPVHWLRACGWTIQKKW